MYNRLIRYLGINGFFYFRTIMLWTHRFYPRSDASTVVLSLPFSSHNLPCSMFLSRFLPHFLNFRIRLPHEDTTSNSSVVINNIAEQFCIFSYIQTHSYTCILYKIDTTIIVVFFVSSIHSFYFHIEINLLYERQQKSNEANSMSSQQHAHTSSSSSYLIMYDDINIYRMNISVSP